MAEFAYRQAVKEKYRLDGHEDQRHFFRRAFNKGKELVEDVDCSGCERKNAVNVVGKE